MYDRIKELDELKEIKKEMDMLSAKMNKIAKPILTDLSYIPFLHKTFMEVVDGDDRDIETRSIFFLIMAYLYTPKVFAGFRCNRFYRKRLSTLFSFISPCTISSNTSTAVFQYIHYSCFRDQVDDIYNKMLLKIKEKEPFIYEKLK